MTHDLLMALGRVALAAGLALVLVLAVRVPARRWLGAAFAYRLWLLVPVAALATLLPAPVRPLIPALQVAPSAPLSTATIELQAAVVQAASFDWQPWLLASWIAGALALVAVFVRQQRRYLKNLGVLSSGDHGALRAQATDGCPALIGALRPRIVVPSDFESRYTPRERELVLAHERTHLARGDAQINALAALLRCLNWFNPLFHLAASRFRFDQEIACDAAVMSRFPEARRCYADAMLKAQRVGESRQELRLPAGCHWPQSHPLKERIAMLKFPAMTGVRRTLASAAIVALVLGAGYASWAAQPGRAPVPDGTAANDTNPTVTDMIESVFAMSIDGVRIMDSAEANLGSDLQPQGERWQVEMRSSSSGLVNLRDGAHMSLLNRSGQSWTTLAKKGGESWEVEGRPKLRADGTFAMDIEVRHNGQTASTPSLLVKDGEPAAVQISDGPARGFRFDFTLRKITDTAPSENLSYRRMYPPKYPAEAVRAGITGKVNLKVEIDSTGTPVSADVESVKPAEYAHVLADAAIAAAMQWRFNPGTKNGQPVGGYVMVPFDFNMDYGDGKTVEATVPSEVGVSYRKMRPPVYPQDAIAAKIGGTLYVLAKIDPEGNVTKAYVDQAVPTSALALGDSAVAAVKSWQFNPSIKNGRPVESEALVPMRFRIEGEATSEPVAPEPAYPDSVRKLEAIVITGAAS